ncbi:hypothetical protein J7E62_15020 [Variovorax paradoxus]|nr:hypothetical protein [Variovorax paradoxus]
MNTPLPSSSGGPPGELFDQSVAGEEDPGASVEPTAATPSHPGDEAPAGTLGTGEKQCSRCGGSGRLIGDQPCPDCKGTGKITIGVGVGDG